jgi:hypothetical protein
VELLQRCNVAPWCRAAAALQQAPNSGELQSLLQRKLRSLLLGACCNKLRAPERSGGAPELAAASSELRRAPKLAARSLL